MSPVWMIEGKREVDPITERNLAERRAAALAAAIREHESHVRRHASALRPQDQDLYRRLRQITQP